MPTLFGNQGTAGSVNGGLAGYMVATKYTLAQNAIITKLYHCTNASGNVKAAIYADSGGSPTSRLVVNNTGTAVTGVTGGQWNAIDIDDTSLTAGTYWIAFLDDTNDMRRAVATAGGSNKAAYNNITYATGCPDPFPAITFQDFDYIGYGQQLAETRPRIYQLQGFQ